MGTLTITTATKMIASRIVTRQIVRHNKLQKRGIFEYMTNYPDKVMEKKVLQQSGGVCQGMGGTPTWLKQPGDRGTLMVGAGIMTFGFLQLLSGGYKLATGKGKLE